MAKKQSWEVSREQWNQIKDLIPKKARDPNKTYMRRPGAGRRPLDPEKVFKGIVFVLRTGIQWRALPKEMFGSPSAIHRYFLEWAEAGFFVAVWKHQLGVYDEKKGICWEWQAMDGAMIKAPLAQEAVGPNPTDRGKKWKQAFVNNRRKWGAAINGDRRGK